MLKWWGTMRLGAYSCKLKRGTLARKAYGKVLISERHRHRYEFNNAYKENWSLKDLPSVVFLLMDFW